MTLVNSLFQGKTASLEEGPAKYRSTHEYYVLHRDESGSNSGRFVQIVKVILYIELIILIGWLGCMSFSYYNTDRKTDCGLSAISVGESQVEADEDSTPTRDQRYPVKRSVTAEPIPESITTKCWSEEQDKILEEERLERLNNFALRSMMKEADYSYTKGYLKAIAAALNAKSISEINSVHFPPKAYVQSQMEYLSKNSSLEFRKEGYEIDRDLNLELHKLKIHSPEWDGYNLYLILENLTASNFFAVDFKKEAFFNYIVRFSNTFNLRYEELGNRESGDAPDKPVFGQFAYVGEEPEKLGIRHLRHILDAFVKFYFKIHEPSLVCESETPTTGPTSESTNAKCWNMEQDPAFLRERRERLKAYTIWNERHEAENVYTKNYLDTIRQALNATNASDIRFDDSLLRSAPLLSFLEYYGVNSSLELHKEALEIARDLYLEIEELKDHTPEWEGYDFNTIVNNLTERSVSYGAKTTPRTIFYDFTNFDRAFNLRYEENVDTDKPMLGKVTYHGEEPEKLGVRHIRHILDAVVRFYFKVRHPSIAPVCNTSAKGGGNTNTGHAL